MRSRGRFYRFFPPPGCMVNVCLLSSCRSLNIRHNELGPPFNAKTRKEDTPYGLRGLGSLLTGAAARLALTAFASTFGASFATEHGFTLHSADTWDFGVGGCEETLRARAARSLRPAARILASSPMLFTTLSQRLMEQVNNSGGIDSARQMAWIDAPFKDNSSDSAR